MAFTVKVGDNVALSVQFLASIGMSHSDLAHARGVVYDTHSIGNIGIARVKWHQPDLPPAINYQNLAIVGPNMRFCQC